MVKRNEYSSSKAPVGAKCFDNIYANSLNAEDHIGWFIPKFPRTSKNQKERAFQNTLTCYEKLKKMREAIKAGDKDEAWRHSQLANEKSIYAGAYKMSDLIKEAIFASGDEQNEAFNRVQDEFINFILCLNKLSLEAIGTENPMDK